MAECIASSDFLILVIKRPQLLYLFSVNLLISKNILRFQISFSFNDFYRQL